MVAIDTNVLVRFLVRDHEVQFKAAYKCFQNQDIYIPDSVIQETEWVLRFAYEYTPKEISTAFRQVFGLRNVTVDDPRRLAKVLAWHEKGLDFSDALHLSVSEHLPSLLSFDERFGRRAKGLSACSVVAP